MPSIDRETYLRHEWTAYPPAPAHSTDVAGAGAEAEWICGRLRGSADAWSLESGGARMEFAFAGGSALPIEILREGDLVALRLNGDEARDAILLAPCLAPSPESRAQYGFAPARGQQWATFIASVREFFAKRGFIEARTPTLVESPGTEPYLDAFETEYRDDKGARRLHLPTSPEFHLKRLLTAGWTRVFEIKDCFRNGEVGAHHEPEFAMLEWYRSYETLDAIALDVADLIAHAARALAPSVAPPPVKTTTIRALFAEAHGFAFAPETSEADLRALCAELGQPAAADDAWDDLFFRAFLAEIEPKLGSAGPVIVRDYPPRLAALARLKPDGWADRLEVYWKGLELANGFHELNDPRENETRFAHDRATKARLGRKPFPQDERLLEAMRSGMPPAGGIALGLDRLFMAILDAREIAQTRPFPFERR